MKYFLPWFIFFLLGCASTRNVTDASKVTEVRYEQFNLLDRAVFDAYHDENRTEKGEKDFQWEHLSQKSDFSLWFSDSVSLFKRNVGLNSETSYKGPNGTISYKATEMSFYRDLNQPTTILYLSGSDFVVQDSLQDFGWNTQHTDVQEIIGYKTHKATAYDSINKLALTAWYTKEIPSRFGPMTFWGLDGLILRLEVRPPTMAEESRRIPLQGRVFEAYEIRTIEKVIKEIKTENKRILTSAERQKEMEEFMEKQRKLNAGGVDTSM